MMIRILQINVGVRRVAQDLAMASALNWDADLLVVSEQNRSQSEDDGWFADTSNRSAVVVASGVPINHVGQAELGFRWVEFPGFRLYSCYCSPNCAIDEFKDFLLRLERSIRSSSIPVIAAGDFNAKSRSWGSPRDDTRGTLLADLMSAIDMSACNEGNAPTFVRDSSESHIDITFASVGVRGSIDNWRVLDTPSLSLHRYIMFEVNALASWPRHPQPQSGWAVRRMDKQLLSTSLALTPGQHLPPTSSVEDEAENLVDWMTQAANKCVPKRSPGGSKRPTVWWSKEIGNIRGDCLKARRIFQRMRKRLGEDGSRAYQERWKEIRKSLSVAIKVAKEKAWASLVASVDNDIWGKPYKTVMKRLNRRKLIPGIDLPGRLEGVVEALFPTVGQRSTSDRGSLDPPSTGYVEHSPITMREVVEVAKTLPNGKAPGPDGIFNEIIKEAVLCDPQRFQLLFNKCILEGRFPSNWKKGKLVLIPKPGKPLDSPSAFRPICLLDGCGKLLEKLVATRLRDHLAKNNVLTDNQYGFRSGRSTLDALGRLKSIVRAATTGHPHHHRLVGVLTLDVRNAFNTAPWEAILDAARAKNVPGTILRVIEAYLSNRSILASSPSGATQLERQMTCGVPQGSVLGPDLWNLFYDDLLRIELPGGVELIAFADDVAVVSTQRVPVRNLERTLESSFDSINNWMIAHGMVLAAEKTEAVVLTRRRVRNEMTVICDGHAIRSKASIRYLGVQVDKKLGFNDHAEIVSGKAASASRQLGFLMPNLGGPRQKSRRLLSCVVTSKLLYGAPIWCETMEARGWKKLAAVHRRSQLRVACCYSTVSHAAAAVVSGIPPIKLLAKERLAIHHGSSKTTASSALIADWQIEWNAAVEGRWTHRLIGDVGAWTTRGFGEVTFHLTQVLTGHGCFAFYLHRFHLQDSDSCAQCGTSPDTAEHAFFKCDTWEHWRRQTCAETGVEELTPENIVSTMLQSRTNWTAISKLASRIMTTREKEERARQGQPE